MGLSGDYKQIPLRKIFFLLLLIVFVLLAMHFFPKSLSSTIDKRFDLDREANVPTWYSTILLFSVALTSITIHFLKNKSSNQNRRFFWLGFSAVFCYLSLDEAAQLHEPLTQWTSFKWVFVYAPFFGMFFLLCVYYLLWIKNDNRTSGYLIIGGLVVLSIGGMVCELISHLYDLPDTLQVIEFVLEEGLELIGTIIVLMGCLHELNRVLETLSIVKDMHNTKHESVHEDPIPIEQVN